MARREAEFVSTPNNHSLANETATFDLRAIVITSHSEAMK